MALGGIEVSQVLLEGERERRGERFYVFLSLSLDTERGNFTLSGYLLRERERDEEERGERRGAESNREKKLRFQLCIARRRRDHTKGSRPWRQLLSINSYHHQASLSLPTERELPPLSSLSLSHFGDHGVQVAALHGLARLATASKVFRS